MEDAEKLGGAEQPAEPKKDTGCFPEIDALLMENIHTWIIMLKKFYMINFN